jgi:endonuclease YncB( thermonuclease family)
MSESKVRADHPPDRLSVDPSNAFFDQAALARGVGIVFNGTDRSDVEEYCVSEGWIAVAAGRTVDRRGRPMLIKLRGTVAPYFKSASADDQQPK